ncbi:MAG: 3,4-dihydroxy-2-butanone-4-phosphate synthase [Actinobacteria bacterium]|nr:3,4-dihydroxy-2-butanone-4-phosphate synthase [Actinomycetota bacterium]
MGRQTPRRHPDRTPARLGESPGELEAAVAALRAGEMVVVRDRPDGDGVLVLAAGQATTAAVAFMIREARGVVSLSIGARREQELGLHVDSKATEREVTISIDAAREAAADLARLAGCGPVAVTCALRDEDGLLLRGAALREFCRKHRLAHVSVGDVVGHSLRLAPEVERIVVASMPTRFGTFDAVGYRSLEDDLDYVALVKGDVTGAVDVALHVQLECLPGQVFRSRNCGCQRRLARATESIARSGAGIIIHLPRPDRGLYTETWSAGYDVGAGAAIGAQILRDLGPISVVSASGSDHQSPDVGARGREVVETSIRRQLLDCDGLGRRTRASGRSGRRDPVAEAVAHV